ncbi:sulfatase-like hydrolase/transferase [Terriglobus sp. 2YAB30_2]|uniref:sulfatase-like hydrolase/transferase n=3 Tax=unclassified Terriglobus TaxID=2628988 RepID=UPI003F9986B0
MSNNRRDFLKSLTASILAPAVSVEAEASASQRLHSTATPQRKQPNVLLMICDDLGYGDLGSYGSKLPTPTLDHLAEEGVRCARHNAAHPICSASRAALLTGRYAARSHTPGALFPHAKVAMAREEQTLANLFKAKGYRTHAIGKWHLGDEAGYLPTDRGFDSFYGVPYSDDMQPLPLMRNGDTLESDTDRDELTPRYTEEALKLLTQRASEPFFLYLAYSYPHDPARGSKAFRGRSAFGAYGDAVEEIDWSVGRLMDALKRGGQHDDTIVLFTSDHGPWFQGSPGNTRGRKGSTFEGGVRVPFLVRWPKHVPAGVTCEAWTSHLDVLPTLAKWCSLDTPRLPIDGSDVSAAFLHQKTMEERSVLYFSPAGGREMVHGIRSGPWKLRVAQGTGEIYINDQGMGREHYLLPQPELYNLESDPMEGFDIADRHSDVVQRLLAEIDRQLESFPDTTRTQYAELRSRPASRITPPGAAPRIQHGPLPDWAWEPPERR